MLVAAMVAAACVGVVQMHLLASPTRSIRLGLALSGVPAGMYGATALALGGHLAFVRVLTLAGWSRAEAIEVVGYTAGPVVEELAKLVPLLVIGTVLGARRRWGLTDHVVLGAAMGAGFGLMEALLRFSSSSVGVMRWPDGGWVLPISLAAPFVPGFGMSLTSFLPAPVTARGLDFAGVVTTSHHLVWGAVAGLGLGLAQRGPGRFRRLMGLVPVLLACVSHAAGNFLAGRPTPEGWAFQVTTWVTAGDRWLWIWALSALFVAGLFDRRTLRRVERTRPELRLAAEREPGGLARLSFGRLPWSLLVVLRFVLVRRAALYSRQPE